MPRNWCLLSSIYNVWSKNKQTQANICTKAQGLYIQLHKMLYMLQLPVTTVIVTQ